MVSSKIISKCMHVLQACLFKSITVAAFHIYISVLKMPLKGEVGGHALKSHGNYIVDHGKSWNCVFEFLWERCQLVLIKVCVLIATPFIFH